MLSNPLLTLRYRVDGKDVAYTPDNGIVSLQDARDGKRRTIMLTTTRPLTDVRLRIDYACAFQAETKFFANGFQTWTDSKEFCAQDRMVGLKWHSKRIPNWGASGDYKLCDYSRKKGVFHSFSYCYLRDGNRFRLLGSLSERNGYTIFEADYNNRALALRKDLEGVTIADSYTLLDLWDDEGSYDNVFDAYFAAMDIAKPRMRHSTGYTSWYNYYTNISQEIIENDLRAFAESDIKIDIFQIDDGYQTKVGDWTSLKDCFPDGMRRIADKIHEYGAKAGLWLAPFGCHKDSVVKREHPEWLLCTPDGAPLSAGLNWGGFYTLDMYKPGVREHLRKVFDTVLDEWGFDMVKLDFLYQQAMIPRNGKSRGQIMCEAMDFLRECCKDKLILGCGVPMAPAFGKVDYCRTGADVALKWPDNMFDRACGRERVSTPNGVNNSVFRRHLDGRAFVNDPDVYFLRDYNIRMSDDRKHLLATINKLCGNLLFVSDDVGLYTDDKQKIFRNMLRDDDIRVTDARYLTRNELCIEYLFNGAAKRLVFDIRNGKKIEGELI